MLKIGDTVSVVPCNQEIGVVTAIHYEDAIDIWFVLNNNENDIYHELELVRINEEHRE